MSLLFRVSVSQSEFQSLPPPCLKFDEFLVESIHSQLVNFHSTIHFRFQSYLTIMFLFFNEENLQLPEMVLTTEISSNFFKYMNLLMEEVYRVFFQNNLPRVLPQMKEALQFSPDRKIGD